MTLAFEITPDDVAAVLSRHPLLIPNPNGLTSDELAHDLLDSLDLASVERAALRGGTALDDQVIAAHDEISRQLAEQGVLSKQ